MSNGEGGNLPRLIVGVPEVWEHFRQSHGLFWERFQNLEAALNIAFTRVVEQSEQLDRIIYFSGRLCAEEFNEIYLLCGNGYGVAALKIGHSMLCPYQQRTI
jgi:hypothetical protein